MQQLLTSGSNRKKTCGNEMCRKTWRPQLNKILRKEGRMNVVDAKLLFLRKENSCLSNNY